MEAYKGRPELQYYRKALAELFARYDEKHGIAPPIDIAFIKARLPVDKPEPKTYDYKVKKPQLRCMRCERSWTQRGKKVPIQCPKCKSPYWNRPKSKI